MQEIVYNGRNNTIDLLLKDDSSGVLAATNLAVVTRVTLTVGGTIVDSAVNPGYFDLSQGNGKLILKLGTAGLSAGIVSSYLTLYDVINTLGVRWPDFNLEVI